MITRRDTFQFRVDELLRQSGLTRLKLSERDIDDIVALAVKALDQIAPTCLLKADVDEPVFMLRAQDATAANTVMDWIHYNQHTAPKEKLISAHEDAEMMRVWPVKKRAD